MICTECNYQNDGLQKECLQCGNELLVRKRKRRMHTRRILRKIKLNTRITLISLILGILLSILIVYALNKIGSGTGNVETPSEQSQ